LPTELRSAQLLPREVSVASASHEYVLTLSCPDRPGIVFEVSGFLVDHGGNILASQQFDDRETGSFFMRVQFEADQQVGLEQLRTAFGAVAEPSGMTWQLHDAHEKYRLVLMVSRFGHCLNDLLFRQSIGALNTDIVGIVSNHQDFEPVAKNYGIPFHHLPVSPETKPQVEAALLELVDRENVHLVVLARYMQVLSDDACRALAGRAINIHHSFLPSFKGAKPYHQAHTRGVKLIGATAHYVTGDLDEGPIIEQEVARVDHALSAEELASVGRDVECQALARAVKWHCEQRVMLNGQRTVVFR
jgi:formyltetrahydrofolate deformylase